jgi:hypothetical protein
MINRILLVLVFTVVSASVEAQSEVVTSPRTPVEAERIRARCAEAVRVLDTHPRDASPRPTLRGLSRCDTSVRSAAIARSVRRLRFSQDTALLGDYWGSVAMVNDANLFEAALEIATDRQAATPARVYALLSLVRIARPAARPRYSNLVGGWTEEAGLRSVSGGCATTYTSSTFRETGTPLPSNWQRSIARLRARIVDDNAEPLDVRTAAWCIDTSPGRR